MHQDYGYLYPEYDVGAFQGNSYQYQRLVETGSYSSSDAQSGFLDATQTNYDQIFRKSFGATDSLPTIANDAFQVPSVELNASLFHPDQIMSVDEPSISERTPASQSPVQGTSGKESRKLPVSNDNDSPAFNCEITGTARHFQQPGSKSQQPGSKPFRCRQEGCNSAFKRDSDLARHIQDQHEPSTLHCLAHGCPRQRNRGFSRWDKIKHHQRTRHRLGKQHVPWGYSVRGSDQVHEVPRSIDSIRGRFILGQYENLCFYEALILSDIKNGCQGREWFIHNGCGALCFSMLNDDGWELKGAAALMQAGQKPPFTGNQLWSASHSL